MNLVVRLVRRDPTQVITIGLSRRGPGIAITLVTRGGRGTPGGGQLRWAHPQSTESTQKPVRNELWREDRRRH